MGSHDAAEMLEVAKDECVRLEGENTRLAEAIEAVLKVTDEMRGGGWNRSKTVPEMGQKIYDILSQSRADAPEAHDQQVAAKALEEAADDWDSLQTPENDHYSRRDAGLWLTRRAAAILSGTTTTERST